MSAAVAVSCAVLVSAAVGYFRPLQVAQNDLEKHQHILRAAGLIDAGSAPSVAETAELYAQLDRRLVDLTSGDRVAGNADTFDLSKAAVDPERSIALPAAKDIARLGRRTLVMPVYLRFEQGQLRRLVLPVYGKGMWSEIYAYLALEHDLKTVANLVIYTHGETPGIGDRIESQQWLDQWRGKNARGDSLLKLGAATTPSGSKTTIDAITGATVTTQSLVALVNFWLGDSGYRTVIERLQ